VLLAFAFIAANAFFVAFEFALVKVRVTQLEKLVEEGRAGSKTALAMRKRIDTWLSASQVGVTLASLALGWVGEPAFAGLILPVVRPLFPDGAVADATAHTIGIAFAFILITFLHIVLGEQVPKTFAIQRADKAVALLALPMRVFYVVGFPVIWFLFAGTRAALRLFGFRGVTEGHDALGEEELKLVFSTSAEAGAIAQERADLLERALSMMEKTARQVLVPRTQMKYIDLDSTLDENLTSAHAAGHTWLPVVRGTIDRVEGVVNVKDLLFLIARGELKSISQVQRPVLFVPESVTLEQLLAEFKRRNKQLAIVVDEHGGTSGIVTLADVVAELVGNVAVLGRKVEPVKTLPGGRLELPGTAQLDDLEHTLEIEFDVDKQEVTTIAGYLMSKLGRIPIESDVWLLDEYRVCVLKTDGPRVVTVRIEPKTAGMAPVASPPRAPEAKPSEIKTS
jgi:CBS domain containing-hemolysin-like protein